MKIDFSLESNLWKGGLMAVTYALIKMFGGFATALLALGVWACMKSISIQAQRELDEARNQLKEPHAHP